MHGTIQDILDTHGVPYAGAAHKHGRPGWVQVDCPWCGQGGGRYHLGISLSSGASACWRCGKHNTAATLAKLTGKAAGVMRGMVDGAVMVAPPMRPTGRLALPKGRGPLGPAHTAYLRKRRLDPDEIVALWGVEGIAHGAAPWGHLKWRLFIPIQHHGKTVSWTTRSVRKGGQRYLSAGAEDEAMPHKKVLYGADYARHAAIVHEGPIDVWATGPGAVGTFGTAVTDAQVRAIARYPVRAICFDSSEEAQARAAKLADELSLFPGETHNVELETGKDAAEASKKELRLLRDSFL